MGFVERRLAFVVVAGLASCKSAASDSAPAPAPAPPPSTVAPTAPVRFNLADVPWSDAPPTMPPGAKVAVLEGDPRKPALFTMRLKLPPGARLAPHTHPADERVTVISGSVHVALGDKFDMAQGKVFSAGAFYLNPTPLPHFLWAEEECVLQVTGIGPWSVHYLDTADAARPPAP
jgi:quercetin dioxygenase-like cupin family protein